MLPHLRNQKEKIQKIEKYKRECQVGQADYPRLRGKHGQHATLGCVPLTLVRRMATIGLPHLQTYLQDDTKSVWQT